MLPDFLRYIPASTLFTVALTFAISLATTLLNLKLVDREKIAIWQREISRWEAERDRAKRTGDKKLLAKVKKQELYINQLRAKIASQQGRTFIVTFIPLLLLWQVLIGFYKNTPVAFIPGPPWLNSPIGLPFFVWYMISSFFISAVLSKAFKVPTSMGGVSGQVSKAKSPPKRRRGANSR